jgi:D-psicose/D-tagatose/L-ribulose 3-epimerase
MRKETMEHFAIVLNIARRFKAGIIGIWPNMPQDASVEAARETLSANLLEMLPQTEEAGIVIALEFEKGCPLDNYREGIEFINSTDTRIRLTCDTYHLFNDKADPYQSVVTMGKLLGDVHISGSHRGEPGTDEFDFKAFMKGLREINYDGPLTLQYHLKDVESVARSCEFTKRLL